MKPADGNVRVLVTRPKHQQSSFLSLCDKAGFETLSLPCIDILPVEADFKRHLIDETDLIIFTSRNAVDFANNLFPLPWRGASVYAIGRATERALKKFGQPVIAPPQPPFDSEAFISWYKTKPSPGRVLIIKGIGGRDLIETTLVNNGVLVDVKAVYKRVTPVVSDAERVRIFKESPPNVISVTSDDVLRNLVNIAGSEYANVLHSTPLVVNSSRCANLAIRLGFDHQPIVANPPGDEGQLVAISALIEQYGVF